MQITFNQFLYSRLTHVSAQWPNVMFSLTEFNNNRHCMRSSVFRVVTWEGNYWRRLWSYLSTFLERSHVNWYLLLHRVYVSLGYIVSLLRVRRSVKLFVQQELITNSGIWALPLWRGISLKNTQHSPSTPRFTDVNVLFCPRPSPYTVLTSIVERM